MTENVSGQQRKGLGLAAAIIGCSLAAGIGLALGPRPVQAWILTILALPVTLAAAMKFAALAMLAWRRDALVPAVLWALLSCFFLLLLLADGEHLRQLIMAAREGESG